MMLLQYVLAGGASGLIAGIVLLMLIAIIRRNHR